MYKNSRKTNNNIRVFLIRLTRRAIIMKVFFFFIGFLFLVIGFSFAILYLNLLTFGYSIREYFGFLMGKTSSYLFFLGLIIIGVLIFGERKKS